MENQTTLEVLAFTDPVCTWCWGSEPMWGESGTVTLFDDDVKVRRGFAASDQI